MYRVEHLEGKPNSRTALLHAGPARLPFRPHPRTSETALPTPENGRVSLEIKPTRTQKQLCKIFCNIFKSSPALQKGTTTSFPDLHFFLSFTISAGLSFFTSF